MMFKTKFFLILFVLHCPPSLLTPLPQPDVIALSNNSLTVLGSNKIEQIIPNNSVDTEVIQQIDVKDKEKRVISNINHVAIGDEFDDKPSITENNNKNGTLNNETNNVLTNNVRVPIGNTPELNNATVAQTNALNTTKDANENNAVNGLIKEAGTLQNGSKTNGIVDSYLVPDSNIASGRTTSGLDEDVTSPIIFKNIGSGVTVLENIDGGNSLQESLYHTETDTVWRFDIPARGPNKGVIKDTAKLESQDSHISKDLTADNSLKEVDTSDEDQKSTDDDEKEIFVLVNSGNIDGVSINCLFNGSSAVKNTNSSNSKLITDLVNSTMNNILSKILQQNNTDLNYKHLFLLLNSGSISNIQISSPILEHTANDMILKDRPRRHLDDTNNTTVESVSLKPSIIKHKAGENKHRENNESNAPDNATDDTVVVDAVDDEDISSGKAPAFRFLIPNKNRKPQHVSTNHSNHTTDNNLLLKLVPESLPIPFDLNKLPINDLLGGAFSFMKRSKRKSDGEPWKINCKSNHDKDHKKSCTKSNPFNDDSATIVIPTRKSLDVPTNTEKTYDSVELVCPLSVIVKLYTNQVLVSIANSNSDSVLNKILKSFVQGNEDAINLASAKLSQFPVPVKLRLQLVHGKTTEFIEQLSSIVDAVLCSFS